MADLSRLNQISNEPIEDYIRRFRKIKFRCKVLIPEIEFVKMTTRGMNFELRKKFEGMEFRDLYELATMAARYEKILLDEQEMKNSSKGTYYKDPNLEVLVTEYDMELGEVNMNKPHASGL